MDELKEDKVIAIFAISTLLVSVPGSNFGFMHMLMIHLKMMTEKKNNLKRN